MSTEHALLEAPPISAARKWAITLTVMVVAFMQILDTSVTNVILPHLQGSLSAGLDEVSWVITSYLAANAVVIPATGWLAALMGRKRFFLLCTVLFTVSSLLSGAAPVHGEGLDRAELLDAVHGALDDLAADTPLLVVVEDVHWADRSTRDLLSFLFTRPFRSAVTVVASYRTDDLHRRHPLRATVAEWARLPGVHRLHERDAVGGRHAQVDERQVEARVVDRAQRPLGVRGRGHVVAHRDQPHLEDLDDREVVVDHQDLALHGRRRSSLRSICLRRSRSARSRSASA